MVSVIFFQVKVGINVVLAKVLCMARPRLEKRRQSMAHRQRLGDIQLHDRTHPLLPNLLESEDEYRLHNENGVCSLNRGGSDWAAPPSLMSRDSTMTQHVNSDVDRMKGTESVIVRDLISILCELKKITSKMKQDEEETEVKNEWKFAALVIDRLCLWICLAATFISTAAILCSAPHLIA